MRGPGCLLALIVSLGTAGISLAQQANEDPAASEQTPIVVPGTEQPPATEAPATGPEQPAPEEAPAAEQSPTDEAPSGDPSLVNPNPLSGLTLESLEATRSAPLFTPSRTAPAVEAPPVEEETVAQPVETTPTEEPPPQLSLIGIILTDTTQLALLRDPSTNEVHRLASGEQ